MISPAVVNNVATHNNNVTVFATDVHNNAIVVGTVMKVIFKNDFRIV